MKSGNSKRAAYTLEYKLEAVKLVMQHFQLEMTSIPLLSP